MGRKKRLWIVIMVSLCILALNLRDMEGTPGHGKQATDSVLQQNNTNKNKQIVVAGPESSDMDTAFDQEAMQDPNTRRFICHISLPEGRTAPAGGITIGIEPYSYPDMGYNDLLSASRTNYVTIPEGASEATYVGYSYFSGTAKDKWVLAIRVDARKNSSGEAEQYYVNGYVGTERLVTDKAEAVRYEVGKNSSFEISCTLPVNHSAIITTGTIKYPFEKAFGTSVREKETFRFINLTEHIGNMVYFADMNWRNLHIYKYNSKKQLEFIKSIKLRETIGSEGLTDLFVYNNELYFYDESYSASGDAYFKLVNNSSYQNVTKAMHQEIDKHWKDFYGNVTEIMPQSIYDKIGKPLWETQGHRDTVLKHSNGCYYLFHNKVVDTGKKQSDLYVYDKNYKLLFTKTYEETKITTPYDVAEDQEGNIYIADSCGSLATKLSPKGKVLAQNNKYSGHGGLTVLEDGNVIYSGSNADYQVNVLDSKLERIGYYGAWSYQARGQYLGLAYATGDAAGNCYIVDSNWQNSAFNNANGWISMFTEATTNQMDNALDVMDVTASKYDGNIYYLNHNGWKSKVAGGDITYIDRNAERPVVLTVKGYKDYEFAATRLAVNCYGSIFTYNADQKLYKLARKGLTVSVDKSISYGKEKILLKLDCSSDGSLYAFYLKNHSEQDATNNEIGVDIYDKDLTYKSNLSLGSRIVTSIPENRKLSSEVNGVESSGISFYPTYFLFGIDLYDKLYYMNDKHEICKLDLNHMTKQVVRLDKMTDTPYVWTDLYGNIYAYRSYDGKLEYNESIFRYLNPDSNQKFVSGSGNTSGEKQTTSENILKVRTKEEMIKAWAKYYKPYDGDKYVKEPVWNAPYEVGELNEKLIDEGVAATNLVRYLAGLPDDIVADEKLNLKAQYGAVMLMRLGEIEHEPPKPEDMSEEFYEIAVEATKSGNLSKECENLTQSVFGYVDDVGNLVKNSVGHRRWVLNPPLTKVGFGWAGDTSVMEILDTGRKKFEYDYIAYPSRGYYPTALLSNQVIWSVQPNPDQYDSTKSKDIKVTIKDITTGKTVPTELIAVDTLWQGIPFCISFKPQETIVIKDGRKYEVLITGLVDRKTQEKVEIRYQTELFDIEK